MSKLTIGFIGQGYIGKNYADDFESRGFSVVRYALEEPYNVNKEKIKKCDIVFIAVPTPTTPKGFDSNIVYNALGLVGEGKIAVIKSTILPGTTKYLQKKHPSVTVLVSPEFLSEVTAAHDAANPFSNIVGMPDNSERHQKAAELVHSILPKSPFILTCDSDEAEIIKYAHNLNGYIQIIFFNLIYDVVKKINANWASIHSALSADPMINIRYGNPVHSSGHLGAKQGRGAGGHCFIKDFAAFCTVYEKMVPEDKIGLKMLRAIEQKNIKMLISTGKDIDLLKEVYGDEIIDHNPES